MFTVEGCARVPAQILYTCGASCIGIVDLDPSHVLSACQAEENVVCNLNCLVASLSYCCHFDSRSAVTGPGVDLFSPLLALRFIRCFTLAVCLVHQPSPPWTTLPQLARKWDHHPSLAPIRTAASSSSCPTTSAWTCSTPCSTST